jgi:hypothetical protein
MQLFGQLVTRSPKKPQKKVCARLGCGFTSREVAKYHQQHDADIRKKSYDQKTTTKPLSAPTMAYLSMSDGLADRKLVRTSSFDLLVKHPVESAEKNPLTVRAELLSAQGCSGASIAFSPPGLRCLLSDFAAAFSR